jgi:mono/diheme cytochrome c family protein
VPRDPVYGRAMRYRALPLSALLSEDVLAPGQVIEVVASDGFVAELPLDLIFHPPAGAAEPYLAIEPSDAPWPPLPGKPVSAGPFYIVWLKPEASGVRSEQWPYMVVELRSVDSPAKRWPALAVDPRLAAGDPIRAGQALFVIQCLACHRLNGAGSADVGPDLNLPRSPTEYFNLDALHAYIRDPASLRQWKTMVMKGFDKDALSDREIDLIIAYLTHMSGRKLAH